MSSRYNSTVYRISFINDADVVAAAGIDLVTSDTVRGVDEVVVGAAYERVAVAVVAEQEIVALFAIYGVVATAAGDLVRIHGTREGIGLVVARYGRCQRHPRNDH